MIINLVNDVEFGEKEAFMEPLNTFLSSKNKEVVQQFMQSLVVRDLWLV